MFWGWPALGSNTCNCLTVIRACAEKPTSTHTQNPAPFPCQSRFTWCFVLMPGFHPYPPSPRAQERNRQLFCKLQNMASVSLRFRKDGAFRAKKGGVLSEGHIRAHPQSLKVNTNQLGETELNLAPVFILGSRQEATCSKSAVSITSDLVNHFTFLKMTQRPPLMSVIFIDISQSRSENLDT